eukprot:TRINITY_DN35456_c0_g1_i1.p1 TRINITY_DN35456_c0_g1~~TRINITY_DN35456_c0_g1_i1.p1  ORF type:complete len:541 (+),score=52.67 TRINITY_DN35456_c0_g1_i1:285-1907(+)
MGRFQRFCHALAERNSSAAFFFVIGVALLVRFSVGLHGYSGQSTPPRFGDYEAQRHWMEVTLHTPIREWYAETPDNPLSYWGLDYPPLTAYQSYLHGLVIHALEPDAVALNTSRGYESKNSKVLMRWTVISADILVFFPAALWFVTTYYRTKVAEDKVWALAIILLQPGLLLIDHGHFQYNCVSLGLALASFAAILQRQEVLGSFFFCLSLNHKQMSMYFAPAVFGHLLGRCLQRPRPVLAVARLGVTVIATFGIVWAPFLLASPDAAKQVLLRLVPLERGLYEDYVANFWCSSSPFIKWKALFSMPLLARMALGTTLLAALPSMLHQILWPSQRGFLLALVNSSLAFFLFAFQVHEKSILLPLLPASLLVLDTPWMVRYFAPLAAFSMFPLLQRDSLVLAYIALVALFCLLSKWDRPAGVEISTLDDVANRDSVEGKDGLRSEVLLTGKSAYDDVGIGWENWVEISMKVSFLGAMALHIAATALKPPARTPFLHEALMVTYSFGHFILLFMFCNWQQWAASLRVEPSVFGNSVAKSKDE